MAASGVIAFIAIVVVSGAVLIVGLAHLRDRKAEQAVPPIGTMVQVEGLNVHAHIAGAGPDLVLIHGSSGNLRDFTMGLVQVLQDRYRVISLDRPGLGWSDPLPEGQDGIHDQARVLQAAASALGAQRPIVLGQSYGAAVALAWAMDLPETVAAVVSVSGPSHPWDTPLETYYKITSHPVWSIFAIPLIAAIYTQRQVDQALREVFAPQPPQERYATRFGLALTMTQRRIRANARQRKVLKSEFIALSQRYSTLQVPIEIVHGDMDTLVYVKIHGERMIQDTDKARLTLLPGIGHMPHHSAPKSVADAVDRSWARRAGQKPSV